MRLAVTATLAALCCLALAGPAAAARPNVVVFETDDQTASSLWAMPNVQRLIADRGATFENSFVSYALCCPSRATFLTGQYAHNHRVFDNVLPYGGFPKLDGSNTLPVWLQDAGYRTIHVGKYLNGYGSRDPTEVPPGWSDWHALVGVSTYRYFGFTINDNGVDTRYPRSPAYYQTDVLARKAVAMVRSAAHDVRPFFMWNAFVAPHFSFSKLHEPDDPPTGITRTPEPAPRDRNRFAGWPLPRPPSFDERDIRDKPDTVRIGHPPIDDRVRAAIQENYQQELESLQAVDRAVGEVVAELERTGQLDRTLVVFTSDNGYFHGEHRLPREKILPYEPSIRVPLVMRGPGIPAGVRREQLVSNQDLAPTILDFTNVAPGLLQDGTSLFPLIREPGDELGRDLLVEGLFRRKTAAAVAFSGVRSRNYFYAEYTNGERELYDLAADPDEMVNRDLDPRYSGLEAELAHRLAQLRTCAGASCRTHPRLAAGAHSRQVELGPDGLPCGASDIELRLRGPDAPLVSDIDVYAGGRVVASSTGGATVRVPASAFAGEGEVTLRATARLTDDRAYTPIVNVRVCGGGGAAAAPQQAPAPGLAR
jgi:N-acetylglucosamine-6-sulfatase